MEYLYINVLLHIFAKEYLQITTAQTYSEIARY